MTKKLQAKALFNPDGSTDLAQRRVVNGDTTNLNDFNNVRYAWTTAWYRQAMNNFWIPEEVNLATDAKDYPKLSESERAAYQKTLSFLIFLDSLQTANLPHLGAYVTANEINLCLSIQAYQEVVHSQSYSYMLDTICDPQTRDEVLYQWKYDEHLLRRNKFIGELYNNFQEDKSLVCFVKTVMANYILEGIYFYSGFMFFYNLGRNNKMPGSAQIIRYINRDENTHLWLFSSLIQELKTENPEMFTSELISEYREMIHEGCEQEIAWGKYVLSDKIPGLTTKMVSDYIKYLGNLRAKSLGFEIIYPGHEAEPASMSWVSQYSNSNAIKTDFFEARNTAYTKSGALVDDL